MTNGCNWPWLASILRLNMGKLVKRHLADHWALVAAGWTGGFANAGEGFYAKRAREAVGKKGLRRAGQPARAAQRAVADAPLDCPLLILESETGSGKTGPGGAGLDMGALADERYDVRWRGFGRNRW